MTEPRALALAWQLPHPPDQGGRIRSLHLLRALAEIASVTLVSFATPEQQADVRELEGEGIHVVPVTRPATAPRWWHHLASSDPLLVQSYACEEMTRAATDAVGRFQPDVIVVDGLLASPYATRLRGTPTLYASHNVESEIYARMLPFLGSPWRRLVARGDYVKTLRWERDQVRRFSHIVAVSERDRGILGRWNPRASVSVVPNGVDTERFRPLASTPPQPGAIVFIGDLSYPPNRDAVLFFVREIFPLIREVEPGATYRVVGRPTPDLVAAVRTEPGVVLSGYVEDVRPHVAQAQVVVVPLRAGGGTRLKILEALAMGRPVVSTSIGSEGLDLSDRPGFRIADGPRNLAEAVLAMLRDPASAAADAAAVRPAIVAAYDWCRSRTEFQRVVRRLLRIAEGPQRPPEATA